MDLVTCWAPCPISALQPFNFYIEASPKAISRRTSYLRVRLAFHPYPQLIPSFFNISGFGPPQALTLASPWSWIDHSVSGLLIITSALIRLAFALASSL